MDLLRALLKAFYDRPEELGRIERVAPDAVPEPYHELLVHTQHMTVTVERFFGSLVDVHVLDRRTTEKIYARKILLETQADRLMVQFGLVRLHLDKVAPEVRDQILAERTPLGRVLIEHNVLREIDLVDLWRVEPAAELCQLLRLDRPRTTYGRTARIFCDGEPAVEVLEIVTPCDGR